MAVQVHRTVVHNAHIYKSCIKFEDEDRNKDKLHIVQQCFQCSAQGLLLARIGCTAGGWLSLR